MERQQNVLAATPLKMERAKLRLLAPAAFLFVLPLAHVTALRSIAFGVSVAWLFWTWRAYPTPPIPLIAPFAAWLALALVSLIQAVRPDYSIGEIKAEILYGILCFLIFFKATRSDRDLNFWFGTLAASALFVGTLALVQFLRGLNPYEVGMYGGTLYYAGYLNTVLPALAATAIVRAGWQRMALICLVAFLLVTAYGSTSRAVWVSLLLELIVFIALYLPRIKVKPLVRNTVLAASIGAVVAVSGVLLYVAKEKRHLAGSPLEIVAATIKVDRRPELWSDSIEFIRERPYTGAGFGRMVLEKELQKQQQDPNHTHAHNIVLNYALQLGLFGPLVLAFLLIAVVRELWKVTRSSDTALRILGIAGISMVGGVLGQSMIEDVFVRHLAWLFWALIGMTLGYAMNRGEPAQSPTRPVAQ